MPTKYCYKTYHYSPFPMRRREQQYGAIRLTSLSVTSSKNYTRLRQNFIIINFHFFMNIPHMLTGEIFNKKAICLSAL